MVFSEFVLISHIRHGMFILLAPPHYHHATPPLAITVFRVNQWAKSADKQVPFKRITHDLHGGKATETAVNENGRNIADKTSNLS